MTDGAAPKSLGPAPATVPVQDVPSSMSRDGSCVSGRTVTA